MSPTYAVFRADSRRRWGARLLLGALRRGRCSTRSGLRGRNSSMNPRACRCGRTESMAWPNNSAATKPPANSGTTGHEWDGIEELNTPLPRWWLWLFYATIIWSVGYWVVYPAWPLVSSYTQRRVQLAHRAARSRPTRRASTAARPDDGTACFGFARSEIEFDPGAARFRPRAGQARFRRQLRTLPRRRRRRAPEAIRTSMTTIGFGAARSPTSSRRSRTACAPATPRAIRARCRLLAATACSSRRRYRHCRRLCALTVRLVDRRPASISRAAQKIFADNCAVCHGPQGKGNRELGAPNLTDKSGSTRRTSRRSSRALSTGTAASCRPGAASSTMSPSRRSPSTFTPSAAGSSNGCAPAVTSRWRCWQAAAATTGGGIRLLHWSTTQRGRRSAKRRAC